MVRKYTLTPLQTQPEISLFVALKHSCGAQFKIVLWCPGVDSKDLWEKKSQLIVPTD